MTGIGDQRTEDRGQRTEKNVWASRPKNYEAGETPALPNFPRSAAESAVVSQ
jgi:hypothetical protein